MTRGPKQTDLVAGLTVAQLRAIIAHEIEDRQVPYGSEADDMAGVILTDLRELRDRVEDLVDFVLDAYEEAAASDAVGPGDLTRQQITEAMDRLRAQHDRRATRAELAADLHVSEKTLSRAMLRHGIRPARPARDDD